MGIRCSLLGHDFGPPETERNREERGDEVVITIRELQVCTRCGAEQVTSESTEVRPVRPAPDSVTEEEPDTAAEPTSAPPEEPSAHPAAGGDEPDPDVEDDAVILEDDGSSAARDPGQWPDAEDTRMAESTDPPDDPEPSETPPDESDDATDAQAEAETKAGDGDAHDTPHPADADESGPEEWPDPGPGDDEGFDATTPTEGGDGDEYVEAPDDPDSGIVSPSEETVSIDDADTIFVCPSCDFQQPVSGSSLRSGDICPNCRKGYLTEQST